MLPEQKTCAECGIEKPLSEFYKKGHAVSSKCKECIKAYRKRPDVKEKAKIQHKIWDKANKNKTKPRHKAYYEANKGKILAANKEYRRLHRKEYNTQQRRRRKTDAKFRLKCNIKSGVRIALKGNKKGKHWEDLVGYTLEQLKKHLEKQFADGMSWENYGEWEIDHKIPISVFNFTKPEHRDFKKCWTLKNLQPMWAKENRNKQATLSKPFQPSLLI